MKKILDGFAKVVEVLSVIIMCVMVVVVFLATTGRYSGLFSIPWSEECSRYCMMAIVYFGLMLASRNGSHFVVEIVPLVFPKNVVKVFSVIVALLVDAFAIFLVRYGWLVCSRMLNQGQTSPMMGIPTGMVYMLIPVGVALMAIYFTIHTFENLKDKPEDKEANA